MNNVNLGVGKVYAPAENKTENKHNDIKTMSPKCEENDGKIVAGLSALAAFGIAAIALKKGKGKEAAKIIKNSADDIASKASKEILDGGNYAKIKNAATKNLPKSEKDIVKEGCKEALNATREAEKAVRQNMVNNQHTVANSVKTTKATLQGLQHATDDTAKEAINIARSNAEKAKQAAAEIAETAKQNPTSKNIKLAKVAENRSIAAQLQAQKVEEKALSQISKNAQEAAKKAANKQAMMEKTSPEVFEAGQKKLQENAQKMKNASIIRKAKRDFNKPGYQRALAKLQNAPEEKLQSVINSPKSSNIEKMVAQDLLGI